MTKNESEYCALHKSITECLTRIKSDISAIENFWHETDRRLSKLEPIVMSNEKEITWLRRLLVGTLITSFTAAVGVLVTVGLVILKHVF